MIYEVVGGVVIECGVLCWCGFNVGEVFVCCVVGFVECLMCCFFG